MVPYGGWGHSTLHPMFRIWNCIIAIWGIAIEAKFRPFIYDKMRFPLTSFQLDCFLLGSRSVLIPLIFAATLLFMVHVFFDVCHPCFTTGESLFNSLRFVPCELASSESLVTTIYLLFDMYVKYDDIVCPYCCLAFIAELFCDLHRIHKMVCAEFTKFC